MKSQTPKVLHSISGRSLLGHVLHALESVEPNTVRVVVGSGREAVEAHIAEIAPGVTTVFQEIRGGTGHATQLALAGITPTGTILVLPSAVGTRVCNSNSSELDTWLLMPLRPAASRLSARSCRRSGCSTCPIMASLPAASCRVPRRWRRRPHQAGQRPPRRQSPQSPRRRSLPLPSPRRKSRRPSALNRPKSAKATTNPPATAT